jgi:hypothetical protein
VEGVGRDVGSGRPERFGAEGLTGGDYFRRIVHGALSSDCKDGPNQFIFLRSPYRVEYVLSALLRPLLLICNLKRRWVRLTTD